MSETDEDVLLVDVQLLYLQVSYV